MTKQILSPVLLRELFNYDPETGTLKWKVAISKIYRSGDLAGSIKKSRYLDVVLFGSRYRAHRLIWAIVYGEHPKDEIDHINGDRFDNRISNLRDVKRLVNAQNIRIAPINNTSSGLLGASYEKSSGMWKSQISLNGKSFHLGRFSTAKEAHDKYVVAKRKLHEGCTI